MFQIKVAEWNGTCILRPFQSLAHTAEDRRGLEYYCEFNLASPGSFLSGVLLHSRQHGFF